VPHFVLQEVEIQAGSQYTSPTPPFEMSAT
jgi:hypothetical protein